MIIAILLSVPIFIKLYLPYNKLNTRIMIGGLYVIVCSYKFFDQVLFFSVSVFLVIVLLVVAIIVFPLVYCIYFTCLTF